MVAQIFLIILTIQAATGLDNGLGLTPQMGWNSWNRFGCNINEALIKKTADQLVNTGLAEKGYVYVNLDDCWQIARNQTTKQIIQDKAKFPNGIKYLADYVHSKGLKFGLYSDAGQKTCQGRPGSYGYEKIDAQTYAKWGVDYLKYDNCYNLNISGKLRYFAMHKALNESGRHIFYSMCNWGEERSWQWAGPYANSWRTTGDISDNWKSFTSILDQQVGLEVYAGRGGWNDPDMLQVGNGGMTVDQYTAHFTFWAILKAPLLIGCSLQNISSEIANILGNQQLIAINQDSLGIQASRIRKDVKTEGTTQIWGGDLSENRFVLVFFNRGEFSADIKINLKQQIKKTFDNYAVRDVINHADLGIKTNNEVTVNVKKHSVQAVVLKFYKNQIIYNEKKVQSQRTDAIEMENQSIKGKQNVKDDQHFSKTDQMTHIQQNDNAKNNKEESVASLNIGNTKSQENVKNHKIILVRPEKTQQKKVEVSKQNEVGINSQQKYLTAPIKINQRQGLKKQQH